MEAGRRSIYLTELSFLAITITYQQRSPRRRLDGNRRIEVQWKNKCFL